MNRLFIHIQSFEFKDTQQFYQQTFGVLQKIVVELLTFIHQKVCFCWLYCLNDKFVIESSEKKLATFAPVCEAILFDGFEVLSEVKGVEEIHVLLVENPAVEFGRIGSNLVAESGKSIGESFGEMAFAIGDSPCNVLLCNLFVDFKRTAPLVVVRSQFLGILADVLDVVQHDSFNKGKQFAPFQRIRQRTHPGKLLPLVLELLVRQSTVTHCRLYLPQNKGVAQSEGSRSQTQQNGQDIAGGEKVVQQCGRFCGQMAGNVANEVDQGIGCFHEAEPSHVDQIVLEVGLVLEEGILRELAPKLFERVQAESSENEVQEQKSERRRVGQPVDAEAGYRSGRVAAEQNHQDSCADDDPAEEVHSEGRQEGLSQGAFYQIGQGTTEESVIVKTYDVPQHIEESYCLAEGHEPTPKTSIAIDHLNDQGCCIQKSPQKQNKNDVPRNRKGGVAAPGHQS